MVINQTFHLSHKFLSRDPEYNVIVVLDMSMEEILTSIDLIYEIAYENPLVYFVENDPIWNQLIRRYIPEGNCNIFILYYKNQTLMVHPFIFLPYLSVSLWAIQEICDKN